MRPEPLSAALTELGAAVIALLRDKAGEMDLTDALIGRIRPLAPVAPTTLPVLPLIPAIVADAGPGTRAFCARLVDAIPYLNWRQTYSLEDGFDRRFLDTYGWTDLVGPAGPYRAEGLRVMLGYWGQGLVYPNHSHSPEEHYLVLAGAAWFRLGDDPYRRLGPGEVFHTPAGAIHSADTRDSPLLALSIWRAEDLTVRVALPERGRTAVLD